MAGMRAPDRHSVRAFLAGVLTANSLAHLATAAAGKEHLTPLAGRSSGPAVNAAWGAANLVGGLVLVRAAGGPQRRWDHRLVAFDAGAAVFAAWMAGSEGLGRVSSGPPR
jgi:hypothetical protein